MKCLQYRAYVVLLCTVLVTSASAHADVRLKPAPYHGGKVSNDGLTAEYKGPYDSATIPASKGVSSGKVYFEVILTTAGGGKGGYWTNAGVTTSRRFADVSSGSSCYLNGKKIVACGYGLDTDNKNEMLRDGDVVSVALDLDARRLFIARNGEWVNGAPSDPTGGRKIRRAKRFYAAVVISKPTASSAASDADTWTINFGASPFVFEVPEEFVSYNSAAQ